jgi:hypothetical protein
MSNKKMPVEVQQEPARQVHDATKALATALRKLREHGDIATLKRSFKTLEKELELQVDIFAPAIADVEAGLKCARERLGNELKQLAREANCEFKYVPPHITFGCVTLQEKTTGVWELSVLDGVPLETIRTVGASRLANRAVWHIEQIEAALAKSEAFLEILAAAYEMARVSAPEASQFSPNLLMLLASFGRTLKKQLVSVSGSEVRPLTRAQFGFLLERIRRMRNELEATSIPTLRFEGAVVQVTHQPSRFVAIPNGTDPRRNLPYRLVSSVALINEH